MWRKLSWLGLAGLLLLSNSGCRICERWYERNNDPDDRRRPYYQQAPAGCAPPQCVPCPPGTVPVGGSGYGGGYGGGGGYPNSFAPGNGCP